MLLLTQSLRVVSAAFPILFSASPTAKLVCMYKYNLAVSIRVTSILVLAIHIYKYTGTYYYDFRLHTLYSYYVVCDYYSRNCTGLHFKNFNMQAHPCMQILSESVTIIIRTYIA